MRRAVAVAEVEGPDAALTLVADLGLGGYHLLHAIRADLLRRLGRNAEAAREYETAMAFAENATEREFLRRRLGVVAPLTRLGRGSARWVDESRREAGR
jgi:RNA polymerase sigma-70 factor (ECF subfamily)